jgi:hypothetical protein
MGDALVFLSYHQRITEFHGSRSWLLAESFTVLLGELEILARELSYLIKEKECKMHFQNTSIA